MREVLLPKLGQTMEEATIETWHKQEGDAVKQGDVLLEITTDKATLEVEAYVEGTLRKIIAEEGLTLPVNSVLALVGDADEALPDNVDALIAAAQAGEGPAEAEAAPARSRRAVAPAPETPAAPTAVEAPVGRQFVSPRARMRAKEHKVSLRLLRGSGPGGRIIEKDVLLYVEKLRDVRITPAAMALACERGVDVTQLTPAGDRITKAEVLAARPAAPAFDTLEPLSAMRRVVAERMSQSQREAPHFYLVMQVDMTDAVALRATLNADAERKIGFNDFLIRACALALKDVPAMARGWADGQLRVRSSINIGLAVALEDGLMVPVVRDADTLSLDGVAAETARLIERARGKKLTPDEYEGGCLTISNLGMLGVDAFAAIVNPGESGILAVGRIAKRPVVVGDDIVARGMMTITLSADHRVVDGAIAARFLARIRELLESPDSLTS